MYFIFGLLHMKTLGEWNLNMSSLFSTTKCFPHRAKRQLYKLYILRILQNNQPPNESWLRLALNGRTNRDFDIPQVAESGHLLPSHLRRLLNKSNLISSKCCEGNAASYAHLPPSNHQGENELVALLLVADLDPSPLPNCGQLVVVDRKSRGMEKAELGWSKNYCNTVLLRLLVFHGQADKSLAIRLHLRVACGLELMDDFPLGFKLWNLDKYLVELVRHQVFLCVKVDKVAPS